MPKKTPQQWADELLAEFDHGRRDLRSGTKTAEQWIPELFGLLDNMRDDLQSGAQPANAMAKAEPASGLLHALSSQSSGIAKDAAAPGGLCGAFDDINPRR
ncbi:MAG: hypothetical protein ABSB63_15925 [Spirochaetia bacterium]|jgi:hypothetical protein